MKSNNNEMLLCTFIQRIFQKYQIRSLFRPYWLRICFFNSMKKHRAKINFISVSLITSISLRISIAATVYYFPSRGTRSRSAASLPLFTNENPGISAHLASRRKFTTPQPPASWVHETSAYYIACIGRIEVGKKRALFFDTDISRERRAVTVAQRLYISDARLTYIKLARARIRERRWIKRSRASQLRERVE